MSKFKYKPRYNNNRRNNSKSENPQKSNLKDKNKNKVIKNEKVDKMSNGNLGYLYYREYYEKLFKSENFSKDKKDIKNILNQYYNITNDNNKDDKNTNDKNNIIKELFGSRKNVPSDLYADFSKDSVSDINFKTIYPGLLVGSGYMHETGCVEGEFKLGFFFDYTTGLPIVPGSSLKGTLRSVFPRISMMDFKDKPISKNSELIPKQDKNKYKYLLELLYKILGNNSKELLKIKKLSNNEKVEFIVKLRDLIFEGKVSDKETILMYDRDIFLDAEIYSEDNNKNNNLFEDDYITPHKEVFKDPIPLKFLKIGPNNKIKFNFLLTDSQINIAGNEPIEISAENKKDLFRKILIDRGIGAKTKVGYGNLE
ncbi:CRISPR-associated protein Cmr6 [Methanococcus voltae]|uniref:CRISPR-associated protein Cmr6 n=1 Tax=Methanococcus voltae TaxID=2188 RepID=A0A8J7UU09_METVO|nr:type III-B CRISPR module RAMP protein Cmr6 [Methanococcus voltae]MBP2202239.1 CRISPR-associated protein Cmr6 [Methanococcus voltae]